MQSAFPLSILPFPLVGCSVSLPDPSALYVLSAGVLLKNMAFTQFQFRITCSVATTAKTMPPPSCTISNDSRERISLNIPVRIWFTNRTPRIGLRIFSMVLRFMISSFIPRPNTGIRRELNESAGLHPYPFLCRCLERDTHSRSRGKSDKHFEAEFLPFASR